MPSDTGRNRPFEPTLPTNLSGSVETPSVADTFTTARSPLMQAEQSRGSADAPRVKARGKLLKLMLSMLVANVALNSIWGAAPTIFLPLQIQGLVGDQEKAGTLAFVATLGAVGAMLAQPIAGMVSDLTRTRFGRRAPWIVIGTLLGGLSLLFIAAAGSVWQLAIGWIMVQLSYNFAQAPLSAVLPDRVPNSARGRFSAFAGLGLMVGGVGGALVGAQFATNIPAGYLTVGGTALIVGVLFVLFNPDSSNRDEPRDKFVALDFIKTFWVNPIKHPDFFWGFTGRLMLYAAYFMISGFQLYILQEYIGLKEEAVSVIPLLGLVSLVGIRGDIQDRNVFG